MGRVSAGLVSGIVVGLLETLLAISLGGLIFSGALAPHAGTGIGLSLFAGVVFVATVTFRSTIPRAVGSVQDVTAAVLVVVAAGIAANLGAADPALPGTVIVAIAITTALTGLVLWLLGRFGLGQVIRFVPYPVVGGFLAGTGWLLLVGGTAVLGGQGAELTALGTWTDGSFLGPVLSGFALALVLLIGTRGGAGPAFVPSTCLVAMIAFTLVVMVGPGVAAATDGGWMLGPFPQGALWPPDPAIFRAIDVGAIAHQWVGILTVVVLAAVGLLLNASGIELATGEESDLDHELRIGGATNLVAAVGGGLPGFHALSLSNLAHRSGAQPQVLAVAATGVVAVTLLFSGDLVARAPRPVVGGLLVFLGLAFLAEWLVDGWSRLVRTDYAVVALIVAAIAVFGFLEGVAVGLAATVVLFVVAYARTDVIRHEIDGTCYPTPLDRPADEAARRDELASAIVILELQGFLFFGTASRLLGGIGERLRAAAHVKYLVVDLARVTGVDSSAAMSLRRAAQIAVRNDATIVLSGVGSGEATRQPRLAIAGIHVEDSLDDAVEWCENRLLAEDGWVDDGGDGVVTLGTRLAADLGDPRLAERLVRRLESRSVAAGTVLIEQATRTRDLFFLEHGVLTVSLTEVDGHRRRLRTAKAGTIVGEVALYLDVPRSASVVTSTECRLSVLSAEGLEALERDDALLAAALHRLLARQLAMRLQSTLRSIEALGS